MATTSQDQRTSPAFPSVNAQGANTAVQRMPLARRQATPSAASRIPALNVRKSDELEAEKKKGTAEAFRGLQEKGL